MKQYRQTLVYGPDCDLPVYDSVDVLVAGGGPSGVAAAETAAAHGLNTLIIEKNGYFAELVSRQRLDDTSYVGKTTMY